MAPRKPKPVHRVTVPSADGMTQQTLRNHIMTRHRWLGFWARNEHEQDHRLFPDRQDHLHEVAEAAEPEPSNDDV